jgi:hypothetical protein
MLSVFTCISISFPRDQKYAQHQWGLAELDKFTYFQADPGPEFSILSVSVSVFMWWLTVSFVRKEIPNTNELKTNNSTSEPAFAFY